MNLIPDSVNAIHPFRKRVREAIEYAIDKVSMAKTNGLGLMEAAGQMAVPTSADITKITRAALTIRQGQEAPGRGRLSQWIQVENHHPKRCALSRYGHRDAGLPAASGLISKSIVADNARFTNLTWTQAARTPGTIASFYRTCRSIPDCFSPTCLSVISNQKPGSRVCKAAGIGA